MYAYFYSIGRSELTTHWSAREPFGEMISLSIITVSEHTCVCVCVWVLSERRLSRQRLSRAERARIQGTRIGCACGAAVRVSVELEIFFSGARVYGRLV